MAQIIHLQMHLVSVLGQLKWVAHDPCLIYESIDDGVTLLCKQQQQRKHKATHLSP